MDGLSAAGGMQVMKEYLPRSEIIVIMMVTMAGQKAGIFGKGIDEADPNTEFLSFIFLFRM